ncbi:MAG: phage terminase small subunit P27 family [Pseudomonadota bacterium]
MGARGRKPLPANIHRIKGTKPRTRDQQETETDLVPVEIPDPPAFLEGYALEEWHEITPELHALGLISRIDRAALAQYCEAWGHYRTAAEELRRRVQEVGFSAYTQETKQGTQRPSVEVDLVRKFWDDARKMLAEFGFTPSARVRVKPNPKETEDDTQAKIAATYFD